MDASADMVMEYGPGRVTINVVAPETLYGLKVVMIFVQFSLNGVMALTPVAPPRNLTGLLVR